MTAEAQNLDQILGPEPTIDEAQAEQPVEAPVEETVAQEPEQPSEPDPQELVRNYKAMAHQERMERKQIQEQMQLMQQRFEQLMQAQQQPAEPEPEYEDDPLGATHAKVNKALQSVEELRKVEIERQQQAQFQNYISSVKQAEEAFAAKTPDYKDAVTYVQSRRLNELRVMGLGQQEAMNILAQDAMTLSQRAQQMGISPAELVYTLAKQTGYTPKAVTPSNVESIAAGQQVAKSVSGGANPVDNGAIPQNLAEMSDEEFEALFKKMAKK